MKTCDLKEIIYLPSGIFTYTTIKTCVFYFVKKREGTDVLETKIKVSKTQKETGRDYKFSKTLQTTKVKFYDYNPYTEIKNLLVEVPIEKIVSNSYSLNYAEYMKDDITEEEYGEDVVVKMLGDVCSFKNGTNITKEKLLEGAYPVVGGGQTPLGFHNEYNVEENTILISKDGAYAGYISKYDKKVFVSNHGIYITKIDNTIVIKNYLYYYLKLILQDKLYTLQTGSAQPGINKEHVSKLSIPIPPLDSQKEIVKYLDYIYEKANKTSNEKILELKELNQSCIKMQKIFGKNEVKLLGDVCNFDIGGTPSRSKNEYYENGNNLWVSVRELNGGYIYDTKEKITDIGVQNSSVKIFAKDTILFSFKLSIGKTAIVGNPLYTNEAIAGILSKNTDILSNKYLYYYLTVNDFSKLGSGLLGKGSLNKTSLGKIKIIIPSLECQKEMIEYCEYNDTLIKQLVREIENNKKQAYYFITNLVKSTVRNDINLINNEPENDSNIESDNDSDNEATLESPIIEPEIKNNNKKIKIKKKVKDSDTSVEEKEESIKAVKNNDKKKVKDSDINIEEKQVKNNDKKIKIKKKVKEQVKE